MRSLEKFKFFFIIIFILQLIYIFHFRSDFKYEILKSSFNKFSGISYAVSQEVAESNIILNKHNIKNFNLSESIKGDTYFYQRFIEFNYPLRISDNSNIFLFLKNEDIPNTCNVIEDGKFLKLIQC